MSAEPVPVGPVEGPGPSTPADEAAREPAEVHAIEDHLPDTVISAADRRQYLAVLALLGASFMLFQIGVLRELRFQLSSIFTLTPFLFSSVVVLIGLGSLAAKRLEMSTQTLLRRTVAALPVAVLPLFAMTILVAQATISHSSSAFDYSQATGSQEQYMNSVVFAFLAVAVVGYGVVFFLQGLVFAVYFREGRRTGLITRFEQIAQWSDEDADEFAAQLGRFRGRVRRDSWVTEAQRLVAEKAGSEEQPTTDTSASGRT